MLGIILLKLQKVLTFACKGRIGSTLSAHIFLLAMAWTFLCLMSYMTSSTGKVDMVLQSRLMGRSAGHRFPITDVLKWKGRKQRSTTAVRPINGMVINIFCSCSRYVRRTSTAWIGLLKWCRKSARFSVLRAKGTTSCKAWRILLHTLSWTHCSLWYPVRNPTGSRTVTCSFL